MSRSNEAKELFKNGFNCSQSLLFTYGKNYFKENALALKLASGFGAGISYRGEMCGTVSGSLVNQINIIIEFVCTNIVYIFVAINGKM